LRFLFAHEIHKINEMMMVSFFKYSAENWLLILRLTGLHIGIVALSVMIAFAIALPLGILLTRREWRSHAGAVLAMANVFQTVPSLAVIGLASAMLAVVSLGIGWWPAIVALVLYSILPVLSNTIVGLEGADRAILQAAAGMGLSEKQILHKVELPLALPVIFAGVRTALVINIGTAALAAAIGADCLGTLIFQGISTGNLNILLAGAIPTAVLAVLLDFLLGRLENRVISQGLQIEK
jgi:osmoprotectant transport system permease protein